MPDTLTANYIADDNQAFPLVLNERWRVVDDPLQWVLQYRRRNVAASAKSEKTSAWQGKRFCRTRTALKRDIRECCGDVDQLALTIINTWPEWHV